MKKIIIRRTYEDSSCLDAIHPLLKRIYLARGIRAPEGLEKGLDKLEPFHLLMNIEQAVAHLVDALILKQHILIVGDFDVDGATSTALAVECLNKMGAKKVSYLVPNRFEFGYGLTPEIVDVAARSGPDVLVTVDNGISSYEGVIRAQDRGMKVIITDHHLPPATLPPAQAIVNPNLVGDLFPSKNLAGAGVIFYVMLALRAKLREMNWFQQQGLVEPNMAAFLDLVALSTVGDMVTLDANNLILVHQGLLRMRAGRMRPGMRALLEVAGRNIDKVSAADLGFAVAPRLNAAGRLVDMRLGVACLLAQDAQEAYSLAQSLTTLNEERRAIERGMQEQAIAALSQLQLQEDLPLGLCLFDASWHQGIIGILASRIKDLLHRPVITFALANDNELKGSGRSIPGLHLKDTLESIANQHPGLIAKFGGHAMAAGLSIARENVVHFAQLFNQVVTATLPEEALQHIIYSDGELGSSLINIETAEMLESAGPWGQGFPEPLFDGQFKVVTYRILKEKHIKFVLRSLDGLLLVEAIAFNSDPPKVTCNNKDTVHIAYRLGVNEYRGNRTVQLLIEHFE